MRHYTHLQAAQHHQLNFGGGDVCMMGQAAQARPAHTTQHISTLRQEYFQTLASRTSRSRASFMSAHSSVKQEAV